MPFASIHFLFIFLPIVLAVYLLIPNRLWRNLAILVSSLVYIAWEDLAHLPVLLVSVVLNYLFGLWIGSALEKANPGKARKLTWLAVLVNLLILFFYKYLGFFGGILQTLSNGHILIENRALPLGISYFTFTGLSYILDVSAQVEKPERNLLYLASYLVMFPKLVQGPITRYKALREDISNPKVSMTDLAEGARRFIIGLGKKVILADSLRVAADSVFEADFSLMGAGVAWFGLLAYTLQIYFDFAGYTDMAIGVGRFLGFKLPENFNFPYISRSISEFWRRWHMTLTSWFRTYVFIPLEFARKKEKVLRQQSNLLIVFLLTGLWHGATWNFLLWGIYFGLVLAIEASGLAKVLKKLPKALQHIYTLLLVMLGWVFFRITDLGEWGGFLKALIGANGWQGEITLRTLNILFYFPIIILGVLFSIPLLQKFTSKAEASSRTLGIALDFALLGVFVIALVYILTTGYSSFIYAQF